MTDVEWTMIRLPPFLNLFLPQNRWQRALVLAFQWSMALFDRTGELFLHTARREKGRHLRFICPEVQPKYLLSHRERLNKLMEEMVAHSGTLELLITDIVMPQF